MNFKHSLVFFSAGVILILFLFLMGVPMDIVSPTSQQQEQNDELDHEMSLKDDVDKEQLIVEENITIIQTESKPIEEMNCTELHEFIVSFEKGLGAAIPLYNEKCL